VPNLIAATEINDFKTSRTSFYLLSEPREYHGVENIVMSIGPIFIQRTSAGSQNPEDTLRGSKLGSGGDRGTANKSRAKSPRGHYRDRSYSQSSDSESQAGAWEDVFVCNFDIFRG
jgi:hypothetical protein